MKVSLSWPSVTGATAYNVYRGTVSGGPYLLCGNLPTTSFTDGPGNLPTNVTFYYRVTSLNSDGESAFSTEIVATAPSNPAAPTGVTVVVV